MNEIDIELIEFSVFFCFELGYSRHLFRMSFICTQLLPYLISLRKMYRSPQTGTISRRNFQICRVIIATSLVWFMIDVFLLMYFTDCSSSVVKTEDCSSGKKLSQSSVPMATDSMVLFSRRKKETVVMRNGEAVATMKRVQRG